MAVNRTSGHLGKQTQAQEEKNARLKTCDCPQFSVLSLNPSESRGSGTERWQQIVSKGRSSRQSSFHPHVKPSDWSLTFADVDSEAGSLCRCWFLISFFNVNKTYSTYVHFEVKEWVWWEKSSKGVEEVHSKDQTDCKNRNELHLFMSISSNWNQKFETLGVSIHFYFIFLWISLWSATSFHWLCSKLDKSTPKQLTYCAVHKFLITRCWRHVQTKHSSQQQRRFRVENRCDAIRNTLTALPKVLSCFLY